MIIYVLQLRDDKFYVGRTENVHARTQAHFDGGGSAWTRLHPPVRVCETFESQDPLDDDKTTLKYMQTHWVDNVRGGSFCRTTLTTPEKNMIQQMLRGSGDACFKCGQRGHFARDCSESLAYEPWTHEEDEQLREENARGLSVVEMSEIHHRSQGAIRSRLKRVHTEEIEEPLLPETDRENIWCCL